jgi:hypothetical protein
MLFGTILFIILRGSPLYFSFAIFEIRRNERSKSAARAIAVFLLLVGITAA